jgi:hypothetical protein
MTVYCVMSTFIYILVVAGCALIALWLAVAVCFGLGMFGGRRAALKRSSFNATRENVARRFGLKSRPVGRWQWLWLTIRSIPLLLLGAALLVVHFFLSLIFIGWFRIAGKPIPNSDAHDDLR